MAKSTPIYKRSRLQQLQCLCETARLGSFLAAAAALDVSNPTVWKQVHALEREFGAQLVEPHGRGCHLTTAGQLLVELAGPAVESMATLRERFQSAVHDTSLDLRIAVTPQILQVELAPCLAKFHRGHPQVRFRFLELPVDEVASAVQDRRADFGFTTSRLTEEQQRGLLTEPAYTLEVRLLAPKGHPLARRRAVRPRDLRLYPLVNAPGEYWDTHLGPVLDAADGGPGVPPIVQASFMFSIHRLVELGFGIGLILAVPSAPPDRRFHERSMRRYFGTLVVHLVRRRGAFRAPPGEAFMALVRRELATVLPLPSRHP